MTTADNSTQPQNNHLTFFIDDFGTRTMCKPKDELPMESHVFSFGLGGMIVPSEAIHEISVATTSFCERWGVPELHGNKIRSRKGKFGFLSNELAREFFFKELEDFLLDDRITAHACVICRPGYRDRYYEKHSEGSRWQMSKTAFDIAVERAAKYARSVNRRLSVVYERTGKKEDRLVESYFHGLATRGTEFNTETSTKHKPLSQEELNETLLTIWPDGKSNAMLQIADLIVHPLGHRPTGLPNRAYNRIVEAGQLIDARSSGNPTIAVKYSCYDGPYKEWVNPRNT